MGEVQAPGLDETSWLKAQSAAGIRRPGAYDGGYPSRDPTLGRITLHGIEVWANHGVDPEERVRGQPFVIHVTLEADLTEAAANDDLAATIDYGVLAREVASAATAGPYNLLETVASRLLDVVLAHPRAQAAEVTIDKPHALLGVPVAGVSVTMQREREG
ncbi:MAG: dihydroneopterin aldolase [Actinomycetota bacterium]|nr:dihydroneopterin aldolase [Actinomycetota bacterium]